MMADDMHAEGSAGGVMSRLARLPPVAAAPVVASAGVYRLLPATARDPVVLSLWHAMLAMATTSPPTAVEVDATAAHIGRRRERSGIGSSGVDDAPNEGLCSSGAAALNVEPKRRRKKRKTPSHVARRNEKAQLEEQVRDLEARANELRKSTGIATASEENSAMMSAVEQQRLVLAAAQSMFSEFTTAMTSSPLETYIHLTQDWNQRRSLLMALRAPKIAAARSFLAARTQYTMPVTKKSSEQSKAETEDGGFCSFKLTVTPFRGLRSPKQVYDALMFYLFNMEITLTEVTGSTTVSENSDNLAAELVPGVLCHRLVTDLGDGLLVEKNSIQFLEHRSATESDAGDLDGEYAIITSDFVNRDDLFPYCPKQRIRKDVNTILRVSSHQETRKDGNSEELVVVLTFWMYVKTHAPQLENKSFSTFQLDRVHDELVGLMHALPQWIEQTVYGV